MNATRLRPAGDARAVRAAHDAFLSGSSVAGAVRDVISASWSRSRVAGIDAEHNLAPVTLDSAELSDYRESHPLARVFPLLYDVLGRAVEECDSVMAIGDVHGRLLWVCGRPRVLRAAETINFVEGSAWDEEHAGTNAPGTALRLDTAVQIHGAEHFTRAVQRWSCAAAPIHDPDTQAVLGVVDVTGGPSVHTPQTLAMVRAAARMAEAEIGRLTVLGTRMLVPSTATAPGLVLEGLGRAECQLTDGTRTFRLSRRHSEILTILADHPDGMTGEQLAAELYDDSAAMSTVRAEVTRLRALLGEALIESRPYRLRAAVRSDWHAVVDALSAGRLAEAVRSYRGPLLPQSDAPGIRDRRERLERQLRRSVLDSGSVDLMLAWTRSRVGQDDLEMWQRQHALLDVGSPLRPIAAAEIARLDEELGS